MNQQNGKGSKRRPRRIEQQQFEENWDRVFGSTDLSQRELEDRCSHYPNCCICGPNNCDMPCSGCGKE